MANLATLKARFLYSVLLFHFLLPNTTTEYVGVGTCPAVTPATGFTQGAINGVWYEQKRYHSILSKNLGCVTYNINVGATTLDISGVHLLTGRTHELHGRLTPNPANSINNYLVNYNSISVFPQQFVIIGYIPFTLLVLYSCSTLGPLYIAQVIVLTRSQAPDPIVNSFAENIILSNALPVTILKKVTQNKC